MRRRTRILIGLGFTFLVVAAALLLLGYFLATKSFPPTTGTMTLAGLQQPVQIYRDAFGMPHIIARSDHDVYFAAGVVQAQDRLWQMELIRRAGQGRLAEILGEKALPIDRLFRTLGLSQLAARTVDHLEPHTRDALQAYTDGVNAVISYQKGNYPLEFDMLGIEPAPWKIEHSILLSKLMAWELNFSRWVDITYGYIVDRLGERKARDLYPDWPSYAPLIIPKELRGKHIASLARGLLQADQAYRTLMGMGGSGTGSNCWAIAGSRSVTGKPVLANDPHLVLTAPARWYEMHLVAPGLDVSGASLAGVPFIVIGRNRHIAWGVTNAMLDDEDFYVEKVDSVEHPTSYLFKGKWVPLQHVVDTILVKDGDPVILTSYRTHRGPIVNRIEPAAELSPYLLSMRWTAAEITAEPQAFYDINRATTWKEFLEGLSHFSAPAQNFVYADVEGHIGYCMGGRIPLRKVQSFASPYPGWTDDYDWKGYVEFDKNPKVLDPPDGMVVTANNRIVDASYPYYLSNHWEPPWRAMRIHEMIDGAGKMTLEDIQRMQLDVISPQARMLVPVILHAYDSIPPPDEDVRTALNYLRNWTGSMNREDVSTTIFQAFLIKAISNTIGDELGPTLTALYDTLSARPMIAITDLLRKDSSSWFDNVLTPQVETKNEIVRKSLEDGIQYLRERLGGELKEWRWGDIHQIEFRHVFGENRILRTMFNVGPFPVGGSHSTVWKGDYRIGTPFDNTVGPSTRQVFDMADPNDTRAVTPPGQSGQIYNRHYDDQIPLWLAGAYRRVPMDLDRIEKSQYDLLTLDPVR